MTLEEHIQQAELRIKWAKSKQAGQPIQLRCREWSPFVDGPWVDVEGEPEFDHRLEYSEKPQLREGYVLEIYSKRGFELVFPGQTPIHVREVEE
jgi:hypothetical protein